MKHFSFSLFIFFVVILLTSTQLFNATESSDGDTINGFQTGHGTGTESHRFEAEVNQLMDIIINSLYSNRDVFLRELISNASDALDKVRFASLTDRSVLGERPDLWIRIKAEGDRLILTDTGVGMTKEELVSNLGTIAKSGTKAFLEAAQQGADSNLIGQFGVGFYSAFLVADKVRVTSKSNDDDNQWIWESTADSSFTVSQDPEGNTLGRGTKIELFLKEDAVEQYTDEDSLEELVHRFSEFINFPIYLWQSHEEERTVVKPKHDDDDHDDEDEGLEVGDEDVESEDDEDEEETYLELVFDWTLVNDIKPIWTRDPKEVTEDEYNSFYRSISGDYQDPAAHIHFRAEGDVNFKAILFTPPKAPANIFDGSFAKDEKPLKLYVKRVFITDNFEDMMPKYLSFVRGVVDSDDMTLNVSREILQQSKLLAAIKKKLVRKSIAMFQKLASEDEEAYTKFFSEFGTHLKWGLLEDRHNKNRLEKLLRFQSSTLEGGALTSLDEYIERMKDGQDQIFFVAGQDRASVESSPLMERLNRRGFEVLFMLDPIDEYVTQQLTRYGGMQLTNIAKEGLKLDDADEESEQLLQEEFKSVTEYVAAQLGDKVVRVTVSTRLTESPSALVSSNFGWTANMERLAKAQALADKSTVNTYRARRVLELNPFHPIVQNLKQRLEAAGDNEDAVAADVAQLTYHSALLKSGFEIDDPAELTSHLHRIMMEALAIDPTASFDDGEEQLAAAAQEKAAAAEAEANDLDQDDLDLDLDDLSLKDEL